MENYIVNKRIICVDMRHFWNIKPDVVFCFKHSEVVAQQCRQVVKIAFVTFREREQITEFIGTATYAGFSYSVWDAVVVLCIVIVDYFRTLYVPVVNRFSENMQIRKTLCDYACGCYMYWHEVFILVSFLFSWIVLAKKRKKRQSLPDGWWSKGSEIWWTPCTLTKKGLFMSW